MIGMINRGFLVFKEDTKRMQGRVGVLEVMDQSRCLSNVYTSLKCDKSVHKAVRLERSISLCTDV